MDAFDVLGLTPALELDSAALEQRYRDLQRALHPDKFVHASSSERRESLSRAVSVNEAYRLLKDDLKRAELLFKRLTGSKADDGQATADPELLMEVMELREELAGARKRRDAERGHALKTEVHGREQSARAQLRSAYALLALGQNPDAQAKAAHALARLRYYRRFQDEAAVLEDELSEA
jgi:molecular chaperone HscB